MTKTAHDSATPANGQQVITACAFIHQEIDGEHQLFMPKRADTKAFLPGVFELPGGHIDFGEDIVTGLTREIDEEFGMTIAIGDPFASFTYSNHIKGSHSIEVIYFAKFMEPVDQIKLDPEDHSTFEWFSVEDIEARKLEMSPEEMIDKETGDDPEYRCIKRGFELLQGGAINFG